MNQIKQINNIENRKKEKVEDKILKYIQIGLIAIFGTAAGIMIIKQIWRSIF